MIAARERVTHEPQHTRRSVLMPQQCTTPDASVMVRFVAKIRLDDACHIWTAWLDKDGYGKFGYQGAKWYAHRFAWAWAKGPLPEGLTIDHTCRNRACVNVLHMELVSHKENCLRGTGVSAVNARKTRCPQGHPYDAANTYRYSGSRTFRNCRACNVVAVAAYRQRERGGTP